MTPSLTAMAPLAAALVWVLALLFAAGPLPPWSTLLTGIGLLATATTAVVGLVVAGARWAHRLAVSAVAATLVVAAVRPIDPIWWLGLVLSASAGTVLFLPVVTGRIRKLSSASGPPPTAVVPPLVLVGTPLLIGLTSAQAPVLPALAVGLSALVFAYLYVRVITGGLWGVRLVWPLLALALAPVLRFPAGIVSVLAGVVVAGFAWRPEVKASYHPPREVGTTFPIPPELTPPEVRDAAGIDEKGRPI